MTTAWTARAMLWAAWLLAWSTHAQPRVGTTPAPEAARRMEISIEQLRPGGWVTVDPDTVFDSGAELRFRVRTNFPANLFVTSVGSTGSSAVLFPSSEIGPNNRLEAGVTRLLPESDGVFRVSGPPGVELLQWVAVSAPEAVSRGPRYTPLPPPPTPGTMLHTLVPRCDDAMFQGTAPCQVTRAPAPKVQNGRTVAENGEVNGSLRARDIVFVSKPAAGDVGKALVRASSDSGVVVYEMRIVHR